MSGLRIVFMGTPDFAVPPLEALLAGPDTVAAVICQPDRPRGRGKKLEAPPVKRAALAAGLPLFQPESVRGADFLRKNRHITKKYRLKTFKITPETRAN